MTTDTRPTTYTVEGLSFLEAWQLIDACIERRALLADFGASAQTALRDLLSAESKVRAVVGIAVDEAPGALLELFGK